MPDTRIDPFTRTPGTAGKAYIDMHYSDKVVAAFESDDSQKRVYKIVGLRGSGKSVEYGKIINHFRSEKKWLVYTLSSAGNLVNTLIGYLSKEPFINEKKETTTVSIGGNANLDAIVVKGGADVSYEKTSEKNPLYYSEEVELTDMIKKAVKEGYKLLVGIDDIAKTKETVKFLSIWSALLTSELNIYLLCTGLYSNIEDFASEKTLSFFIRSDDVLIKPLDKYEISVMYQRLLSVDETEAVKLAKFTNGYAYAYQVLGSLYFNKEPDDTLESLTPEFDSILFRDSYEHIWSSLPEGEKNFIRALYKTENGKASDIKQNMNKPSGYSSYKSRLENRHLVFSESRGYLKIDLPRFEKFVTLWHGDEE